MTKQEFKQLYFQEIYSELEFLYYSKFIKWQNKGNNWWTFPKFITHGQKFKKQLLQHVYSKRDWDLSTLSYK